MPKMSFTPFSLKALKPPAAGPDGEVTRIDHYDVSTPGFYLRLSSTGRRTWMHFSHVMRGGKRSGQRFTLGDAGPSGMTLAEARSKFKEQREVIARGEDPKEIARRADTATRRRKADTFEAVAADYVESWAKEQTRTWKETERIINAHLVPRWGSMPIGDISRRDVSLMIAGVKVSVRESKGSGGETSAGHALAKARAIFNWYAARDEKFVSPVVRQHGKDVGKRTKRERVLADAEIRRIWAMLDTADICPAFRDGVKTLFLTAQRRGEVFRMRWPHLTPDNHGGAIWAIPAAEYKNRRQHVVHLTPAAYAAVCRRPRFVGCDYVFTTDGKNAFSGYSKCKAALDKAVAGAGTALDQWGLHDIRRTCRSLMAQERVPSEIAERVVGHLLPGVEGIYNRYDYADEKKSAMEDLNRALSEILTPVENKLDTTRPAMLKAG